MEKRVDLIPAKQKPTHVLLTSRGEWQLLPNQPSIVPYSHDAMVCARCRAQSSMPPCVSCFGSQGGSHGLIIGGELREPPGAALQPVLSRSWLNVFLEPYGEGLLAGARAGGEACHQWWAGTCWLVLIMGVGMLAALRLQQGGFRTPWLCEGCGRPATYLPEGVVPRPCCLCGIRLCIDCVGYHN